MGKKVVKWIIIVVAIVAVMFAGFYAIAFRIDDKLRAEQYVPGDNPVVDLSKYVKIESSGYEGYGTIKANIEAVKRNDYKTITFKEGAPRVKSVNDRNDASSFINLSLDVELSKTENLCNGDVITYNVIFNNSVDQYVDCKFENVTGTYTVDNLAEITEYDPFENLTVNFQGIAPCAYVDYNTVDNSIYRSSYVPDKTGKLKNGDTVTFVFEGDEENLKKVYGKSVSVHEKTYTVENMPEYVLSADGLSENMQDELKALALEGVESSCIETTESIDELEYAGEFFFCPKEYDRNKKIFNKMYIIYKSKQIINDEECVIYYPVLFTNMFIDNGQLNNNSYLYVDFTFNVDDQTYCGINNVDDLYYEMVELEKDVYDITAYDEMKDIVK